MPRRPPGGSALVPTPLVLLGLLLAVPARGQSGIARALHAPSADPLALGTPDLPPPKTARGLAATTGRSPALVPLAPSASRPLADETVRFDRALAGSAMGAAVGGLLGAALISSAEPNRNALFEKDEENEAEALGLLLIAGGAPAGAVLHSRIPHDHVGAYVMAVLGELVLGGAGIALGTALGGDSDRGRLIGGLTVGGTGVILGAAGGAVLGAPGGPGAAVSYEDEAWRAQLPSVQIGVHRQPPPGLHGTVSLVRVEL